MNRDQIDSVLRSLRRVNLQGSFFGQTVAIRFGLSESDIEALEVLIDTGSTTAGTLSELMGLTTGAVTRVIDRLEQAGYVRRVPDPADRRRVIVEVVPDKVAGVQATLGRVGEASTDEIGHYSEAELAVINDFLTRMAAITREEATALRQTPDQGAAATEHSAPIGGLSARGSSSAPAHTSSCCAARPTSASSTRRSSRVRCHRSGCGTVSSPSSTRVAGSGTGRSDEPTCRSTRRSRGTSRSSAAPASCRASSQDSTSVRSS